MITLAALSVNMTFGILEGSIRFGSLEFVIENTDELSTPQFRASPGHPLREPEVRG